MNLPAFAVNRPVTTTMIFVAIILIGIFSLTRIPIDLFPEIEPPIISVITAYPGAGAEDVENNVTEPLERTLGTVSNLNQMTSTSEDNVSLITLEFDWGVDLNAASNDVRDQLELARQNLPEDVEFPTIFKIDTGLFPVIIASFTAEESYFELNDLIDDIIGDAVRRVPGVGTVNVGGGPVREIHVEIDPQKLEAYNLTLTQVNQTIASENANFPVGNLKMGLTDYNVRLPAEFNSVHEMNNVVLSNQQGEVIYLRDVATIQDTFQDISQEDRLNGRNGITLIVQKQSDANTVTVAQDAVETIEEELGNLPADVEFHIINDSSEFILNSVSNLATSIILGAVFVILVVLFFLQRLNATFIVATVLPTSLIGAFIFLYFTDNSLNVISLSSLAIALGMVVDDAIVILENITTKIEQGSRVTEAAIYGSSEVGLAVFATTLTVVAVFFPLVFLTGIAGVLFSQLGFLVSITVSVSTFAALTLIPMLASRYLRSTREESQRTQRFTWLRRPISRFLNRMNQLYHDSLLKVLNYRGITLTASIILFIASLALIPMLGTEFMPASDTGQVQMVVELDAGIRLEETLETTDTIENWLMEEYSGIIEAVQSQTGVSEEGGISTLFTEDAGSNIINFTLRFVSKDERERTVFELVEEIRAYVSDTPGLYRLSVSEAGGGIGGGASPINLQLISNNTDITLPLANEIADRVEEIPGTRNVEVSIRPERPELVIQPDREKIARLGLNSAAVASALNGAVQGFTTTQYRDQEGEEYDIRVRVPEEYRNTVTELANLPIQTAQGNIVRLQEVADIQQSTVAPSIDRIDQERVVSVTSDAFERSIGEITGDINQLLASMDIPQTVEISFGGDVEDQQEAFADLVLLLVMSIILVYIVMASQFENYRDPFVIMFSIPFSFTGVFIALFITGYPVSVVAFLAAILLIGIVVKNAIVLVDYVNILRDRGQPLLEAISEGSTNRLRPVLMTALTTMLAMLPLALSTGEGSETWQPLGIAVVGGLFLSTFLTMYIVPVIYSYLQKEKLV